MLYEVITKLAYDYLRGNLEELDVVYLYAFLSQSFFGFPHQDRIIHERITRGGISYNFV